MKIETADDMVNLGLKLGQQLKGGEIFELIGDVGAGKTTFTHGLAKGLDITDAVQSPSFTISCSYPARDGLTLNHYDFYRLSDPGIVAMELADSINDPHVITVIEWGESVRNILPPHTTIEFKYLPSSGREVIIHSAE